MRWPFKPDDWIALFFPGLLMLMGGTVGGSAHGYDGLGLALGAIYLAVAMSVAVGFYLTEREKSLMERWAFGALFAVPVFFVNAAVAFAGCALTGVLR